MSLGNDFIVIGAGPAGAAAASILAKRGFNVTVYEANSRLGSKPCGRGIPSMGDLPVRVPRDTIVRKINGAVLYVDNMRVFDIERNLNGVIVDKEAMLEAIISESGANLVKGAIYKRSKNLIRIGGKYIEIKNGLLAGGHSFYPGETINAIQYRLKSRKFEYLDKLIIYFDTKLIGYYYIFPNEGNEADVGVGGYASFNHLKSLLEKFIKSNEVTKGSQRLKLEGARIAVGGINLKTINGLTIIGEAAGYVLPLTGEGIRPSIISGAVAAKAIIESKNPLRELEKPR